MGTLEQVLEELLESGRGIERCLSMKSPHFIEFIQRRQKAVEAIAKMNPPAGALERLKEAEKAGVAIQEILRSTRRQIEEDLSDLNQKKAFLHEQLARHRSDGIDLKA